MELILTRIAKRKAYTIGRLSVGESYLCDTLEPTALELKTKVSKDAVLRSSKKVESGHPHPCGQYRRGYCWLHLGWQESASGQAVRIAQVAL